ncbi:unnamed protein product [Rotaria socialis]|uniref:G-protein coupled receptors family 1 profile domain-containing protein n=1 Tax=Rotaria socialis TaxID=392032 RepID=A0A818BB83_9BILA|nr:unnamed protein product [Rotaria socialis]CAF3322951.1 unnamed protein product [Rotaria socialis]CAF3413228.1 unnamed protein product [Rotaria socialis]CAF3516653.1 unnamed protein product [Rotaria socialis]CAF3785592.1 unnamed protein product [Rotaria socialis]
MADNTSSSIKQIIEYMLSFSEDQRTPISVNSTCQYTRCTISTYNTDDYNITCRVTAAAVEASLSSLSNQIDSQSDYAELVSKYMRLYIYPVFILSGIFGNALSFFIMLINCRHSRYPASLYLTLLAFVDCLYLTISPLLEWITKVNKYYDVKISSDLACRLVYLFGNFTTHLSAGLVVSVTVERFIAVQYPLLAHKINHATNTRVALAILVMFFLIVDCPIVLIVELIKNEYTYALKTCNNQSNVSHEREDRVLCGLTGKNYEKIWVYVDFVIYNIAPFFIIITLNSSIIRRLIEAHHFRRRMFRFSNTSSRSSQQDGKHRHFSESYATVEMIEHQHRHLRCYRSIPKTKPLTATLHTHSSHSEKRCLRYNTKISSTSTEVSTISTEIKNRSRYQYEVVPTCNRTTSASYLTHTRLTILLLFVSFSFLVLTLPAVVVNLVMSMKLNAKSSTINNYDTYSIVRDGTSVDTNIYYTFARLSMIINHSINFVLYFVLGKRFRHDLKQLLVGYWRKLYR